MAFFFLSKCKQAGRAVRQGQGRAEGEGAQGARGQASERAGRARRPGAKHQNCQIFGQVSPRAGLEPPRSSLEAFWGAKSGGCPNLEFGV